MALEISPLDTVELDYGLRLLPRLQFQLIFMRADRSVKAVDEWHLKEAIKALLKNSIRVSVADSDLVLQKEREPQKKRREEPVAIGVLFVWDIEGLLRQERRWEDAGKNARQAVEWSKSFITNKLQGVELNVSGLKLRCEVCAEDQDGFDAVKQSWEGYHPRNASERPDTLILKGVPSRWFAEPRVSSKASVLVTHTIFSKFGMIRNLEVNGVDAGSFIKQEAKLLAPSLQCQMWVQYETFSSFSFAMKAFCGRSMKKEGTDLKANYVMSWDRDGYFLEKNVRKRKFEQEKLQELGRRQLAYEARKAEIAFRNAEFEQIESAKQACISREDDQKQKEEALLGELRRQEEEMHAAEENLRKGKLQMLGNEQDKRGSQLQEQRLKDMAKDIVHRDENRHAVEVEINRHKLEHSFQRSEEELPKLFQDIDRFEERKAFDAPELRDTEEERWALESITTEASLAMSTMLEQAAFKLSMLQPHKGTYHHHEKRSKPGYPSSKSQENNFKRLCSKVVQNS
ncbi:hypothetical protein O6H91_12G086600 [Diphasiastrum complanatum]|uniref:Uncharacterized protein n=1 Tax=Diphasiastrum complanatum TaxID=34168 RepID=A0ACC2C5F9_DIPCM|nr:hypothetical protein O6H91_12G086600 [Diphasiastrum complanatum]